MEIAALPIEQDSSQCVLAWEISIGIRPRGSKVSPSKMASALIVFSLPLDLICS